MKLASDPTKLKARSHNNTLNFIHLTFDLFPFFYFTKIFFFFAKKYTIINTRTISQKLHLHIVK